MAIHITQIGKKKFICGLFWQSLSRPQDLWNEASELSKKIDADLMVLRKDHTVAQAGFGHSRDGARSGYHSLAAIISKTLSIEGAYYDGQQQPVHNWLCALKLPDGTWTYCAARDANFLPNGDFAGSKEEVLDRLHGDYGLGGWNVVIGDAELDGWGFHNFSAKTVEDLLPKYKSGKIRIYRWSALRSVKRAPLWMLAGAWLLGLSVVCGASYLYLKHVRAKELEALRLQAIKNGAGKIPLSTAVLEVHPWKDIPLPRDMIRACSEKLAWVAPGGWSLDSFHCTPHQATHTWSRAGSNVSYLLHVVPGANVDLSTERASYSEALSPPPGTDEALRTANELVLAMASRTQAIGADFRVQPAKPAPAPAAPKGNPFAKEAPPPSWQGLSFSLSSPGLPLADSGNILAQPGVRINLMTYRDGAWSFEGVIHAKQ